MIPVLTAGEMRAADRRTIEEHGVSGATLMEAAGGAVADAVRRHFPAARRLVILCGKGNNGGDGFVAARHLFSLGPVVALLGRRDDVRGDARTKLLAFEEQGGSVDCIHDPSVWERFRPALDGADLVLDALLGTGLRDEPTGLVARAIEDIGSRVRPRGVPVVAVDVPSGLSSDSPEVSWPAVSAALTVTFGAPKVCLVLPPASDRCGRVVVADIGIPQAAMGASQPALGLLEAADVLALYPRRDPDSHKGTHGHLLVVAGSLGMAGAAGLSAAAALRSGVGLVTIATPKPAAQVVASWRPEAMTMPLPATGDGKLGQDALEPALALARSCDAAVLGPGLGSGQETEDFARAFARRCPLPLLIDADGLNAIAAADGPLREAVFERSQPTVLTPHPGEMGRLMGARASEVQAKRWEFSLRLARELRSVVALKGRRTIVARPDGRAAVNPTGNPGLARGGTGDVLAGMIGALLARGADPFAATCGGVFLHGLAGDCAAKRLGEESMLAGDVIEEVSGALRALPEWHG